MSCQENDSHYWYDLMVYEHNKSSNEYREQLFVLVLGECERPIT